MQSKTLYLLLAFAVTIAVVTAYLDEEDDLMTDFEEFMLEKRARKGRGKGKGKGKGGKGGNYYDDCPDNPRCVCAFDRSGNLMFEASCRQINAAGVGI